jgi:protein O-mannosyl-transferase
MKSDEASSVRSPQSDQPQVKMAGSRPALRDFSRFQDCFFAAALVAAVFLAYQPAWQAGFIWDDNEHLTENPCIVGPLGLKEIWTSRAARICPLTQTTFWLEHAAWGLRPMPYHLVNLLLHATSALVLWQVLRRLNVLGAGLGAALWALHPVQVESAAWITELKNTQSGLFYLLTILSFVNFMAAERRANRTLARGWYGLALLCAFLAMASKSSTVVLPAVLGLCMWWLDQRWRWDKAWRLLPFLFLSAVSSAVAIWTTQIEMGDGVGWERSWQERIIVAGKVVWFYLGKLAWPHPLIFVYPRWKLDTASFASYLPTLTVVLLLLALGCGRRGWGREAWFAFTYYVLALLPVLGLVNHYFIIYSYVGDHFQYLASMGILALAGAGLAQLLIHLRLWRHWAGNALCLALLIVLAVLTWHQSRMYKDNDTLYQWTIGLNPSCGMAHNNLGLMLEGRGQFDDAIAHYEKAMESKPNDWVVINNLGHAYLRQGRLNVAMACFQQALKIKPNYDKAHHNLGRVLFRQGRFGEAITHYQEALAIEPDDFEAENDLGNALAGDEQYDKAIDHFQKALKIKPDYTEAHINLGNALAMRGRVDEAITHYLKSLEIKPDDAGALQNLALARDEQGKTMKGLAERRAALRMHPDDLALLNETARILATNPNASIRNGNEAVELAGRALTRAGGPEPAVLDTLAAAYAESGRFPDAVQTARKALDLAKQQGKTALAESIQARIRLYESATPLREPQ